MCVCIHTYIHTHIYVCIYITFLINEYKKKYLLEINFIFFSLVYLMTKFLIAIFKLLSFVNYRISSFKCYDSKDKVCCAFVFPSLKTSRRSCILFCRVSFDHSEPLAAPGSFNSWNEGRFTFPLDVPDCKPNFLECFLNSCGQPPSFLLLH